MRVLYVSSVLNHHQIEFCDEMYRLHGNDFHFVTTMEIEEQRVRLGYKLYERPYNIKMHLSEENKRKVEELFFSDDVVILDVFMEEWLQKRLKENKLTFLYKERLFKAKPSIYWFLRCFLFVQREYRKFWNGPLYMLGASAATVDDFALLRFPRNHVFTWGYFPPFHELQKEEITAKKKNDCLQLLWAGRLIDWKHPEYVLSAAVALKKKHIRFHLNIIGNGELEALLQKRIHELDLEQEVSLLGSMPPTSVREYMERANIYLFTSNRAEGFGAVLTEAMNSACAVIASATAGGTGLLIHDGENGRIYQRDSEDELVRIALELAGDPERIQSLGWSAYETIRDVQNAKTAASRFSEVAKCLLTGAEVQQYSDGPMKRFG